jgi:hypothetical protein
MLYLNPPYFIIDGVSIFPDHADPLQFYYLPMAPQLTMAADSTGKTTPRIQLIEYEGAAGTGGFINFDVNIGIDPDKLQDVGQQLQQQAQLSGTPRLSPVTFVDGEVKLVILGAESTPTDSGAPPPPASGGSTGAAAAPAAGPRFVTKIQGSTKPALFGDNQASFSVQLDQYGATVLEQALQGEMSPIAVIYELEFVALRPAFRVHLTVDWNRVQTALNTDFSAGVLFFSTDIEKEVDKLIENQAIVLQIDSFTVAGDGGASTSDDLQRATSEVYDMIKSTFFESSLAPPTRGQPDGWDQAANVAREVSSIAATGGLAACAAFSYKQVDISRTDNKTLNVDISERTSVQRTIYPQGHLNGLLAQLDSGFTLADFIVKVDLDNPWFQRRTLNVVTYADFDNDQIASIDVNMTYNGQVQSAHLTKAAPQASVNWSSVLQNGQMVRPVTYTYTVNFAGVDTSQRPSVMTSGALTEIGDVLSLQPRGALYSIPVIPIRAEGDIWQRYPSIEVACRYDDPANNIHDQASAVLTSDNPQLTWPMFMVDPTKRTFTYQLVYTMAEGGVYTTPWLNCDAGRLDVEDPFPSKATLMVLAAVDWTQVDQVLAHLAYPDKDNPATQKDYIFNANATAAQVFVADKKDQSQSMIYYEAKIIMKNGRIWSVPGSLTSDSFLTLQAGMHGHQVLTIKPEAVDFNSLSIASVDVYAQYQDPAHNFSSSGAYRLTAQTDVQFFAYEYLDPSIAPQFRYDVSFSNGQTRSVDWAPASSGTVTIALSTLN